MPHICTYNATINIRDTSHTIYINLQNVATPMLVPAKAKIYKRQKSKQEQVKPK